eukprot:351224-Chlamydomonas_euryale.AAC.2
MGHTELPSKYTCWAKSQPASYRSHCAPILRGLSIARTAVLSNVTLKCRTSPVPVDTLLTSL